MAAYNTYEAVVNGVVGAVFLAFKSRRNDSRAMLMYGIEKGLINIISSLGSGYVVSGTAESLDVEYVLSAVLAGLYHSRDSMGAAGDQLMVSVISHFISTM